ncbi:uncharacterized protein SPPG_06585 [Spizellomyces punctatus DAOM BR117]|uniref:Methyltransferase domain-containing protein n=1 Tax=Spizellomyces punctatus (strain DAOM BR117) TaxID=645134 RepID=A0A0L0HB75_SPIPD|nr:uncharacterized protein SPPG_06585 [Spizellomyces punctatus DAOM BR117]KNC98181.1 hypothetical protein SPPG_06585 [Spizellomyces punctatus DAOM BR117]|eukprot:XP_016606221.1 hypothetical protein SPPG_06585 [Spizellomyces punctatus DAOM BR117]
MSNTARFIIAAVFIISTSFFVLFSFSDTPVPFIRSEPTDTKITALENQLAELKLGRNDQVDAYVKCLTKPEGHETFYNVQRCLADIKHKHIMKVVDVIEKLPAEELQRFAGQGGWDSVPKWIVFDLFQPTYECNAMDFIRIGAPSKTGDTGKWICTDKLDFGPQKKCVIYSLGSNNQFDFEQDMHRLFPECKIHTLDCTGNWADPSTTFHSWCVGGEDKTDDKGRQYKRLSTVSKELGVDTISLLKMDIENFEWPFFIDLLNEPVDHRPMQILVEFHAGMPSGSVPRPHEIAPTLFEGWNKNWAIPMVKMLKLFDQLGYRIAWQERNRWGEFATEIILIHERAL